MQVRETWVEFKSIGMKYRHIPGLFKTEYFDVVLHSNNTGGSGRGRLYYTISHFFSFQMTLKLSWHVSLDVLCETLRYT